MTRSFACRFAVLLLAAATAHAMHVQHGKEEHSAPPTVTVGQTAVHVLAPHVLRVTHVPDGGSESDRHVSLVARAEWPKFDDWNSTEDDESVTISTALIRVVVDKETGLAKFYSNGAGSRNTAVPLLSESGHMFTPTTDLGKATYVVEQTWTPGDPDEALFGGGEFQNGIINFKNAPIQLVQFNTEAIVPNFVSTTGYGILWDNYAWSYLNPADPKSALQFKFETPGTGVASFVPASSGVHHFYIDTCPGSFGCGMGKTLSLSITDGTEKIDIVDWQQLSNLPNSITGRAKLIKDKMYEIHFHLDGFSDGDFGSTLHPPVLVQRPDYGKTVLRSMVGNIIDYYFTYADGTMDSAISGYRDITGPAPLYPLWVYGFWQCREHYATQQEVLDAAHGFRNRSIPVDNIVQDWHYWGDLGWGPQWDPKVYPDPKAMVAELKSINFQLMVSVWSKYDNNTYFFKDMTSKGQMLNGTDYYDPWNSAAREQFYQYSKKAHFDIGVAALWLDATEPENFPNRDKNTALGSGNALFNTYSLMTTKAITDGLKRDYSGEQGARPFSLTRSSFAGQQRSGAALWSGDTSGAWDSLRRQVSASLNYQMSGIPYWSQDIGGFFRPDDQYTSSDYRDMLVRWFHFGAFVPIYRVHGGASHTEPWHYGGDVMERINATNNLRYRMLPYTYSGFARVQNEGYTMQRAMVLAYGADWANVGDQFMWGEDILVAPVVTQADNKANSRNLMFPPGLWYNFWTGDTVHSTNLKLLRVPAPIDASPIYVRAGAILPLGPLKQYTTEKLADPLEVRIYAGADGFFSLYEDDGLSANAPASKIAFHWDDAIRLLTVDARVGSFQGMLNTRTFQIVMVGSNSAGGHGTGVGPCSTPDKVVTYDGSKLKVQF
eukprot:g266.t1